MREKVKTNSNGLLPQRLRDARLAKGLSIKEIADLVGLSRQIISQYELGNVSPSPENLLKMQQIYQMPTSYYYKPYSEAPIRSQEYFRSFQAATKSMRETAVMQSMWVTREVIPALDSYVKLPAVDPLFAKVKNSEALDVRKERNMETLAKLVRREWDLGLGPIVNLTRVIEKRGVVVIVLSLDDKLDAFSFWEKGRPYIFVSKSNNAVRMRMSVAHELCHLLFHDTEEIEQHLKQLEDEAKWFANAFLMPQGGFEKDVFSTSLNQLLLLKPKWKVSVQAMIMRCERLELISDERSTYLWKQISRQRWRKVEPYDDQIENETPVLLQQAVKLITEHGVRSRRDLAERIALQSDFIEQVCGLELGFLSHEDNLVKINFSKDRHINDRQ
ncbi:helix-turn-helix domain-containing protein [Sporomusa malonica]|uniref:Zn-dependent peptidase ImmA, M78 family n=1 Tax=Sporomusa malonica TaxID=112901 RepID=A0A1W2F2E7_9FIRM|nr:XRE family transcriptional regulator [Sporomusa malonica]SMD16137.1 Zn-dependent peptidase ImmA, M78 family [Sporomusa malonica]